MRRNTFIKALDLEEDIDIRKEIESEREQTRREALRDRFCHESINQCCGIIEIGGFSGHSTTKITESLKEYERFYSDRQYDYFGGEDSRAMLIASTTGDQRSAAAALKACGFEKIGPMKRPKPTSGVNLHKATITFWYKVLGKIVT